MGIFSDLLNNAVGLDVSSPTTALDKQANREIDDWIARGDADYSAAVAVTNEVQSLSTSTQTSGNMTLTFLLANGETFTTGNIAFNAVAATIETAIDSAATTASITGWTNGDISVSGGAVNVAPVVFTFDGGSVSGANHPAITLNDVSGAGGAWGTFSTTTEGQTGRSAWAALVAIGIAVDADIPAQGVTPTAFTRASNPGNNSHYPSDSLIRFLASEAAIQDGNAATEGVILDAARLS